MLRTVKALSTLLAAIVVANMVLTQAVQAEEPKSAAPNPPPAKGSASAPSEVLGTADSWTAYTFKQKDGRVCYLIGQPEKSAPTNAKRRQPMAMVTHRPQEKAFNVVSFNEGYPLKEGSDVTLDIGGGKFTLFVKDEGAWAATSDLDKTITEALAKGKRAEVTGISQRGTTTVDTYSLTGFSKALGLIDAACGVKR
jgi:hypothetical protein